MQRALPDSVPTSRDKKPVPGDLVTFPSIPDTKNHTFNLGKVHLPEDIKDVFRFAIEHHPTRITHATQVTYWYGITTFARFADEDGLQSASDFTTAAIDRYQQWLATQVNNRTGAPWSNRNRGRCIMALRQLIHTVKTWKPELLRAQIVFPTYCYPDGTPQPRTAKRQLTRDELKSLLWTCQQDIRENNKRFQHGRQVLAGTTDETIPGMRHALQTAEALTQTGVATNDRLLTEGISQTLIHKLGYAEGVRSHLAATSRTLAPIFVALIVQLAGNVEPIRKFKVDCVRDHEINPERVVIEWHKPRAGRAGRGTQRHFAHRLKRYGAPQLIAMVLTMTEPVRALVEANDRDKLFLCERIGMPTTDYRLISYNILQRGVRQFLSDARARINEWNKTHPKNHARKSAPSTCATCGQARRRNTTWQPATSEPHNAL